MVEAQQDVMSLEELQEAILSRDGEILSALRSIEQNTLSLVRLQGVPDDAGRRERVQRTPPAIVSAPVTSVLERAPKLVQRAERNKPRSEASAPAAGPVDERPARRQVLALGGQRTSVQESPAAAVTVVAPESAAVPVPAVPDPEPAANNAVPDAKPDPVRQGPERGANGRFVSKDTPPKEKSDSAAALDEQKDDQDAKNFFQRVTSVLSETQRVSGSVLDSENDATDTAGAAAGGTLWEAAKEVKELATSAKDKYDESREEGGLLSRVQAFIGRRGDDGEYGADSAQHLEDPAKADNAGVELRVDQVVEALEDSDKEADKRNKALISAITEAGSSLIPNGNPFDVGGDRRRPGSRRPSRGARLARAGSRFSGMLGSGTARAAGALASTSAATGGMLSKAGGYASTGLRMGASALRFAGPVAAAAGALYGGVDGYNDEELHKKAFGLEDGEKATLGQKMASAAAGVADMGGLTSGLINLLGGDTSKADIADSIYSFFGGVDDVKKAEPDSEKPASSKSPGKHQPVAKSTSSRVETVGLLDPESAATPGQVAVASRATAAVTPVQAASAPAPMETPRSARDVVATSSAALPGRAAVGAQAEKGGGSNKQMGALTKELKELNRNLKAQDGSGDTVVVQAGRRGGERVPPSSAPRKTFDDSLERFRANDL